MVPHLSRAALTLTLSLVLAVPAGAQDGFLFRAPALSVTLRATHAAPRAEGDVFDFMTGELTLDRGDFAAQGFGIDAAVSLHERFALVLGVTRVQATRTSDFRDWVGDDDLPIEQTTQLLQVPVTVSLRWYPLARGRSIATHAWIPARLVPYLQAGGGYQWYRLTQRGDFVDYETLAIFRDDLRSSGSGALAQVAGGLEYWVTPRVGVNAEGRYGWGSADLHRAFAEFDRIDLSGYQAALGLSFRF
ncbi:MAG TPA: hypothetical protein VK939_03110 [Longimicrobiales bacterium]|nr:hypothetical protein [Longimicrobiales bacterium]